MEHRILKALDRITKILVYILFIIGTFAGIAIFANILAELI